jgi:hypothetical protein
VITVTYDPNFRLAAAIPDNEVMAFAVHMTNSRRARDPMYDLRYSVNTGLVIDAIRVLVKTGKFPHELMQFEYRGITISIDKDGRCDPWPEGFNDTRAKLLSQLQIDLDI